MWSSRFGVGDCLGIAEQTGVGRRRLAAVATDVRFTEVVTADSAKPEPLGENKPLEP